MSSQTQAPAPRQHAYSGPALPQLPEPSHAERVRTLLDLASVATLATLSKKHPGFPFGSLMPYALDETGRPLFLISNMAMHTHNLKADGHASLFVSQAAADGDPLGAARATVVGTVAPLPTDALEAARTTYLARHENSRYWVDFADFGFFRLEPIDVYYVGGFGVMGWVAEQDYRQAAPDPLAPHAQRMLAHMNQDHAEHLRLLAAQHAGLLGTEATMTGIDRLGFTLRLKTEDGMKGARINFPHEVATIEATRAVLVGMVQAVKIK